MALIDKAMLVRLSISLPGNSRTDQAVTNDTIERLAMAGKSGRWLKQIFPDEAYKPLIAIQGEIRTYHYSVTLPWTDEGWRILPSAMYLEYMAKMREYKARYEAARDDFLTLLPDWEAWAKSAHNGSFDPSLYDRDALARKFGLSITPNPIPSGNDFRIAVDAETRAETDQRVNEAETAAAAALWHRLADPLRAMVERLKDPKGIFRDSLVQNIRDIVSLVPKLNLTGDNTLAAFAAEAATLTAGETATAAQVLRDDKLARSETAKRAEDILKRMAGYVVP